MDNLGGKIRWKNLVEKFGGKIRWKIQAENLVENLVGILGWKSVQCTVYIVQCTLYSRVVLFSLSRDPLCSSA